MDTDGCSWTRLPDERRRFSTLDDIRAGTGKKKWGAERRAGSTTNNDKGCQTVRDGCCFLDDDVTTVCCFFCAPECFHAIAWSHLGLCSRASVWL